MTEKELRSLSLMYTRTLPTGYEKESFADSMGQVFEYHDRHDIWYALDIDARVIDRFFNADHKGLWLRIPLSMGSFNALTREQLDKLIEDGAAAPQEKTSPEKCICKTDQLMIHGCKCGAMKAEKDKKKAKDNDRS